MNKPKAGFNKNPHNINKKGRPPKGHSITETIKQMMNEKPEIKKALGQKVLQMALKGDITAMKTLWNYMDGLPVAKQEITGKDGTPLGVVVLPELHEKQDMGTSPRTTDGSSKKN